MTEVTNEPTTTKAAADDSTEAGGAATADDGEEVEASPDVHFEPVIKLEQEVEVKTHEEDENTVFKMRAKMFRFDKNAAEWKERGTGDCRLLQHKTTFKIRLVSGDLYGVVWCVVTPDMNLAPNVGSDRSWVYNVAADFAEGEERQELLAIRFANAENAQKFKSKFEECQKVNDLIVEGKTALTDLPKLDILKDDKHEKEEDKEKAEATTAAEKK